MTTPRLMPRFARRLTIRYRDDGAKKEISALTRDVGPMGIGVLTQRPAPTGAALALVLDVPDRDPIEVRGRVVWSRRVPADRRAVDLGGFGVLVTDADERWYTYVAEVAAAEA